ncbi:MAG: hexokinase family protein [Candidatus Levyibacteriota bacterium]
MDVASVELLEIPDYQQIKQNFVDELTKASQNQPSSLSFIKHTLPSKPLLTKGIVQGIVIGGTNYIVSTEQLTTSGKRNILKRRTGILPIFTSKQSLIDFFSEHLDQRADADGLNFGFRMEPTYGIEGSLDGIAHASGTKDHTFTGLDISLGTLIKTVFNDLYGKAILSSVANDTICLLLSGGGYEQGSLIAGTGINIGIRHEQNTLVNLELGGFDKFNHSAILRTIDSRTKNPGKKLFEKTTSGKYLSLYFNEKIKELGLQFPMIKTSQELSELSQSDQTKAGELARAILKRSAYLLAAAIAGVYEFTEKPHRFTFIGEGSMLWEGWKYQEHIQEQLHLLGISRGVIEIHQIKDSSINGAIGLLTK